MTTPKRRFRDKHYLFSICFFALALISKPMAVSLPAVLLILDWFPLRRIQSLRSFRAAVIEKLPFVALSLASAVLTILAQSSGNAIQSMKDIPLMSRILVAASSLVAYLCNLAFPVDLSPYYPYPQSAQLFSLGYVSRFVLAIAITAAGMLAIRRQKLFFSVWSYYVITLVPVLGIIQVGGQAMADRYMYLPSLGPLLLIGLGAAAVWDRVCITGVRRWSLKIAVAGSAFIVSAALIYLTGQQIKIWHDSLSLLDVAIEKSNKEVVTLYINRGVAYERAGLLDKAISDYDTAIGLNPSYVEAYLDRGVAFQRLGREDYAISDFIMTLGLNPGCYQAFMSMGLIYLQRGSYETGVEQFNGAIRVKPDFSPAYGHRGLAYYYLGQYDAALEDLNMAIGIDPGFAEAYATRGKVYLGKGEKALAVSDFQVACKLGYRQACALLQNSAR